MVFGDIRVYFFIANISVTQVAPKGFLLYTHVGVPLNIITHHALHIRYTFYIIGVKM
jgi:hypothetical protein